MSETNQGEHVQKALPEFGVINSEVSVKPNGIEHSTLENNKAVSNGTKEVGKEHPWGIARGTKVYSGPWNEDRPPMEIGVTAHAITVKKLDLRQDGPYTSLYYSLPETTPTEVLEDFRKMGIDAGWVIRQVVKGRKNNPWFSTSSLEEPSVSQSVEER